VAVQPFFHWILTILLFACLASFFWAMRAFFRQPSGFTSGMRVTSLCGFAAALIHFRAVWTVQAIPSGRAIVAASMYVAAFTLFWWAILANRQRPLSAVFSDDAPEHLVQRGPYRWIRHPFYCSYLTTWAAGLAASWDYWVATTVALMLAIYIRAAVVEERKFGNSPLAGAYARYQERTGLFFPNVFKLLAGRRSA
jgi:protein-S-isoprenylcysteine O-methyltransferase Ste14